MNIIQAAQGRLRMSVVAAALATAALTVLVSQAASARTVTPAAVTMTGSATAGRPAKPRCSRPPSGR
jgi:hypothetical protein